MKVKVEILKDTEEGLKKGQVKELHLSIAKKLEDNKIGKILDKKAK